MAYIGFLPCRSGSERVPNKNMRRFASFENGLLELKLEQMAAVDELAKIIVSSNDPAVLDYAARFAASRDTRVVPLERPDELGRSSTSMDDFILYIAELDREGTILWSHVTSPFVDSETYRQGIRDYETALIQGHDSLVSVTRLQRFFWNEDGPVNYDRSVEKWPRSQDLKPLMEINHALYIMPFALMREVGDRVGRKPYFYHIDEHVAADIDWEEQFELLERIMIMRQQEGRPVV